MTATVLDGAALAADLRRNVSGRAATLIAAGITPGLAVVLVGDDPASAVYVKAKSKAATEVGVTPFDFRLPADCSQAQLLALVATLNGDPRVHGILLQMPLPKHINSDVVLTAIDPSKDVDGLHPLSLGLLAQGRPGFVPCTPRGVMHLLAHAGANLAGARAVVLGRSVLVGKPMALLLSNANATVILCHSKTRDVRSEVQSADIVVAAIGRAGMVGGDWIREGAIVIDVGINRGADGKLLGDVAFAEASLRASAITPVPRGVGPMTIACLLENTVDAAGRSIEEGSTRPLRGG
jgi:methylenetetrahydrofolate dehydrogenase (NADP+) / methenyltetrahydrofolate cyclohydrolase